MENSVNQSETGSTKVYVVMWTHEHRNEIYSTEDWTNIYTRYFNSEEEAKEFANEDNLIATRKEWGAHYDEDCGWNGGNLKNGDEINDYIVDLEVSEVKINEISCIAAF